MRGIFSGSDQHRDADLALRRHAPPDKQTRPGPKPNRYNLINIMLVIIMIIIVIVTLVLIVVLVMLVLIVVIVMLSSNRTDRSNGHAPPDGHPRPRRAAVNTIIPILMFLLLLLVIIVYYIRLYENIPHQYIVLYHRITLYYTILHYITLYYIILCCVMACFARRASQTRT